MTETAVGRPHIHAMPVGSWTRMTRIALPLLLALGLALLPAPTGLPQHSWYYFAIFVGVVSALILEPVPGAVVGLLGVTLVTLLSRWAYFSPAELAKPGFSAGDTAVKWALSGFSNTTVWLIFGAFMFAMGYEQTGLGRRIALALINRMGRRTLTLGYAIVAIETVLAPFIPSNTARTGGTIYPIIRNVPPLYESMPNDPSARKIGSYIMWTSMAACCVSSSLFMTAFAPNLLAMEILRKTVHAKISWGQWFMAFAPVGIPLLLLLPALVYVVYPPKIREGNQVVEWARRQLDDMGPLRRDEVVFGLLVGMGLLLWIFAGSVINATTVVLVIISLMVVTGVVEWSAIVANRQAWNTLVWFATLIALADGLNHTGFVKWLAGVVAVHLKDVPQLTAMVLLLCVFFVSHYLFASVISHITALLPVTLAVGQAIPGMPMETFALLLALTLGIMGVLTPYGTGPSPIFFGSGYLPGRDYWRLGAGFGAFFFLSFLAVCVPILTR